MQDKLADRIKNNNIVNEYSLVPQFPKNMLMDVTNVCNDECIFCANSKVSRKRRMMDLTFGKRILQEAYENGTREVGFYATGEPLANKELEKYIAYAKQIGYEYVYITTNGALLDKKRAESLLEAGIDSVKFSINASNSRDYFLIHGRDDFERVRHNIIEFNNARKGISRTVNLFISCILTNYTQDIENQMKSLFKDIADEIFFAKCCNQGGYMPEINECLAIGGDGAFYSADDICPMPFKTLFVSVEGYLTMCCTDFQNYLTVADLNKESLKDAWNGSCAQNLRKAQISHDLDNTLCFNCMHNTNRAVEPLIPEHAISFDYGAYDSAENIKQRIMNWMQTENTVTKND